MPNTALFDAIKAAGPLNDGDFDTIAEKVFIKLEPLQSEVHALQDKVNGIATGVETLSHTTATILQIVEPPHVTGDAFGKLRKCLQLLSRLEDWILADRFNPQELQGQEFDNLRKECLDQCPDGCREAVDKLMGDLKTEFPQRGDLAGRATYYLQIGAARDVMLRCKAATSA